MLQGFKCPNCGGDKLKAADNNSYKCAYCGQYIKSENAPQVPPPPRPTPPPASPTQNSSVDKKSRTVAIILAFFLGGLGIHKFYLRQVGWGILYLVLCWSYLSLVASIVDIIILAVMSDEEFDRKYN